MTENNSNNNEEDRDDINFCKKLETVALGCHLEVHTKIGGVFKKHKIESYQCVEFILDTPLGKDTATDQAKISYPFLFRLINSLPFIYRIKHDAIADRFIVTTVAKTRETLKELRDKIRIPTQQKGHSTAEQAYDAWKSNAMPYHRKFYAEKSDNTQGKVILNDFLLGPNMQGKIKQKEYDSRVISSDFLLSPWLLNGSISSELPFRLFQIPIATEVSFFGYFLVAYQESVNNKKTVINDIHNRLEEIVKDIYVPTLILFHVSKWEDKFDNLNNLDNIKTKLDAQFPLTHWVYSSDFSEDEFKPPLTIEALCEKIKADKYSVPIQADNNSINWLNEFLKTPNFYDILRVKKPDTVFPKSISDLVDKTKDYRKNKKFSDLTNYEQNTIKRLNRLLLEKTYQQNTPEKKPNSKQNEFEAAFGKVWERRMEILNNTEAQDDKTRIKNFKDKLYFHKYNIASPGMIELIRKLINGAEQMKRPKDDGESLPAALVFGEAGSGKDIMARLISLFTEDYSRAKIGTINMAALKPNALAIPLLFGIEIGKENDALKINIDGMLINDNTQNNSVIILDELNSLDHDLQGSLLRILENGEVRPLFGSKTKHVENLIIGIVNEDPEIVSREKEFKELKAAEAFLGKVIGSFLYKNFYSVKKLRPDLMYRLKRGLYIRIPPLHERREDIPILFAENMRKALKSLHGGKNLAFEIEMDALERLMKEDIDWPGNIRQLEAVTKEVASKAYEKHKETDSTDEVEIDILTVEKVLKDNYLINNHVNDQN